jgi:hypothetical protein
MVTFMKNYRAKMPLTSAVKIHSDLDFGVILEGLLLNPESYVNFGNYWWTLKRMIADWAEENGADVDPALIRGTHHPPESEELDESEVFRFLDQFSGRDDFMDWIAYINPMPIWGNPTDEETSIEDPDWEENFL